MKKLLVIFFLFFSFYTYSVAYLWTGFGGNSDWNNNLNWNPNSGFPGSTATADTATISGNVSLNITPPNSIATLTISGGGTLSLNGNSLTVTGNVDMSTAGGVLNGNTGTLSVGGNWNHPVGGGTFNEGNSTIDFTNTGTIVESGSFYNLTVSGGVRTITSIQAIPPPNIAGNLRINNGSTLDINGNDIELTGTFTTLNTGTLRLQGSETLTNITQAQITANGITTDYYTAFTGNLKFNNYFNLIIEDGTRTVAGNSLIGGTLQVSGGTFSLAASTLGVTGNTTNAGTIQGTTGAMTFGGAVTNTGTIQTTNTGILTFNGTVNNSLTIQTTGNAAQTYNQPVTNSGTISTSGNGHITFALGVATTGTVTGNTGGMTVSANGISGAGGIFNSGSGTVGITGDVTVSTFNGQTSTLTITGNVNNTTYNSPTTVNSSISGNFQTTNFNAGNMTTGIGGNFTVPDGTFTEGTGTVNFTNGGTINQPNTFYNLTVSSGTRFTNGQVNVENDLLIALGAVLNINNDLLDVNRDITITGTLTTSAGNINVGRNWNRTGTFNFVNNITTFDGGAGGTIAGTTFYDLQINGTGSWSAGITTVNNDLTITSGTLNIGGNALDVNRDISFTGNLTSTGGSINVARNWMQNGAGVFTPGGNTVIFDTAAMATISGNTTFNSFNCTTAGKQINFTFGTTQTINGTLTLTGGAGAANKVFLRSTAAASWNIQVAAPQTVDNVDVQYSQVIGVVNNDITANTSINSGNNDEAAASPHWIFTPTSITWTGAGGTNWATASSWDVGYVPNYTDDVTIPDVANDPDLDIARTVRNLNITTGILTAATAGDDLTVTQTFALGGVLDIGSNVLTAGTFNNTGLLSRTTGATTPIDSDSGTTRFYGSGGNIPGGNYNILTVDQAGQTFDLAGTVVTNNANNADLNITANTTLNTNGNNLSIGGSLAAGNAGTVLSSAGTEDITVDLNWNVAVFNQANSEVIFTGTGSVVAGTFYDLTISGGNRTLTGNITMLHNWNQTGGTLAHGNFSVTFDGNAGTQTVRTSGQTFYDVIVSNQAGRSVQLMDIMNVANDFIFYNGNFYFNGNRLLVTRDLYIFGGTFEETPGVGITCVADPDPIVNPLLGLPSKITVGNRFELNCLNNNIYMHGAGGAGNRWGVAITGIYFGSTVDTTGFTIIVSYSNATVNDIGGANIIWGGGTLTDCIKWLDTTAPWITDVRIRINTNRMYLNFSENVYDEAGGTGFFPINDGNLNTTPAGLLQAGGVNQINGSFREYTVLYNAALNITDITAAASSINGRGTINDRVMDVAGNFLNPADLYPLGSRAPQDPPPFYRVGIDFFTNLSLSSYTNTSADWDIITDFSGVSPVYFNGLVLNATMDAGLAGTPQIQYILSDSIGARFMVPPLNSGVITINGQNTGGNNWRFSIPISESDGNKYIIFVFSINIGGNTWYCYRPLYAAASADTEFFQCESYIAKLRRIITQNNNTTILNNVINPDRGETTKLMYTLDNEGPVSIVVYDLNSDVVRVLRQENDSTGIHTVTWDGRNENGKIVARGVYFIRIRAPGIFNQIRKVLVIK